MIEQAFYDLSAAQPAARRIVDFTRSDDRQWAGIIELPALGLFETDADERTDVYVLHGNLTSTSGEAIASGAFLSLRTDNKFTAGEHGAVLFVYREPIRDHADAILVDSDQRPWRAARVAGMRVADLVPNGYQVSLVEWGAGTYVGRHDHGAGEEIFVLEGALESQGGTYHAGSWLRLHPGATHTPRAEEYALIILRNSHLLG